MKLPRRTRAVRYPGLLTQGNNIRVWQQLPHKLLHFPCRMHAGYPGQGQRRKGNEKTIQGRVRPRGPGREECTSSSTSKSHGESQVQSTRTRHALVLITSKDSMRSIVPFSIVCCEYVSDANSVAVGNRTECTLFGSLTRRGARSLTLQMNRGTAAMLKWAKRVANDDSD